MRPRNDNSTTTYFDLTLGVCTGFAGIQWARRRAARSNKLTGHQPMKTILTIAITFALALTASGQSREAEREITRAKVKAEVEKAWALASESF